MSYRISIPKKVTKRMEKLSDEAYERIDRAILDLAEDPHPPGSKKLRMKTAGGFG